MNGGSSRLSTKRFEDLEFLKKGDLGKGGYASVRQGQLRGDPQIYAVKIVTWADQIDLSSLSVKEHEHMRKEIAAHSMMDHGNIIKFHHLIEHDHTLYMLLEFAEQGDLYKLIVSVGKFSEEDACKIVAQVALALEYIHSKGILHRDLKPENILLTKQSQVKVSDFGWCGEFQRLQRHAGHAGSTRKTFCGTYEYMAPEVIRGDHQNEKVDVWSLGILLYELLHGKTPFHSSAPLEIQKNIIEGRYSFSPHLSREAVDLLKRILHLNPALRYSVADVLRHPFILVVVRHPRSTSPRSTTSAKPTTTSTRQSSTR